jgi:tetratricopeptide (TPR) repeat protein
MLARYIPLMVLVPVLACHGPDSGQAIPSRTTPGPDAELAPLEQAVDAARRALDRDEYELARAHLANARALELAAKAQQMMDAGRPLDALVPLDEALELGGRTARVLLLRGQAALQAAPASSSPQFFYEDATQHLVDALRAGAGVEIYFEASRAARRIPDPDKALALARRGAELLETAEPAPTITPHPSRTWAEAAFDVYIEKISQQEEAREYFIEAEDQFARLLGRTPEDTWPRLQLANLYEWAGENVMALKQLEQALEVAPTDQSIHDRLQQLAVGEQGYPQLLEYYRAFAAARPDGRVLRNLGVISFYAALEAFEAGTPDVSAFEEAEAQLLRARELDESLHSDCLGFEAIARNARGWCHYNAGELLKARDAFLSMEDLFEGGLAWSLGQRLPDGISGLGFVVAGLTRRPNSLSALDNMVAAAEIADYLHGYRPENGNMANDAGFVNRDAAVLLMRAAQGSEEGNQELKADALKVMSRSWAAYKQAARLLPEDVRVVNDTGLVMTYYLRTDPEEAERLLLSAIEHGAVQVPKKELEPGAQAQLEEAWGDAHQNMAILELTLRGNAGAAKDWLQKSLDIGPATREGLRPLLADCERMLAGEEVNMAETIAGRMVWIDQPTP